MGSALRTGGASFGSSEQATATIATATVAISKLNTHTILTLKAASLEVLELDAWGVVIPRGYVSATQPVNLTARFSAAILPVYKQ